MSKNSTPISRQVSDLKEAIRERIIEILSESSPKTLKSNELSQRLGIPAESAEYEFVRELLEELQDESIIFKGPRRRYGRVVADTSIEGELRMLNSTLWGVIPEGGTEPVIRLDKDEIGTGFHGDMVKARPISTAGVGEIPWGEVTSVVERNVSTIVGTLRKGREIYLQPDSKRIHQTITVQKRNLNGAKIGDKVIVELLDWNDPEVEPSGKVIKKLGRAGSFATELEAISETYDVPTAFPDEVIEEAESFSGKITEKDLAERLDLRDAPIFTIDPYDARDFDDAIHLEHHEDGDVTLGVHIADVSHFVQEGSALDEEALKRATSIYLVTGVVPMLPERLSNDLCSLRPNEDRLAYSVLIRLSPRGGIRDYEIRRSVINSKRRFTYEEALEVLETGEGDFSNHLSAIQKIVLQLRANRKRKGSIDFSTTELKFKLDENDVPVEVIPKKANDATRLIEDCMLLANRVVAEHIATFKHLDRRKKGGDLNPFIYRIHDVPPKDKLIDLSNFVKQFGYNVPVQNVQPKDFQKLIEEARQNDQEELITEVTLRSMAKAVYSEHNIGHFGLAFTYYTHFTSPIRRYPDLIVHRLLKKYADGMSGKELKEIDRRIGYIASHCSARERVAVDAERKSIKIAEVEYLSNHVGDVFEATVISVLPFGMFCELRPLGIQGLIPLRSMKGDYYRFNEKRKELVGSSTNVKYRIGDDIHVRVERVDQVNSEIDLGLIEEETYERESDDGSPGASPKKSRGSRASRASRGGRRGGGKSRSGGKGSSSKGSSGKGSSGKGRRSGGSSRKGRANQSKGKRGGT